MTSKLSAVPRFKVANIPEALRQAANLIECGDMPAVRCVLITEAPDGQPDYRCFGDEPFTKAHAVGLCFVAATELVG